MLARCREMEYYVQTEVKELFAIRMGNTQAKAGFSQAS
jgi:hypothetical protein